MKNRFLSVGLSCVTALLVGAGLSACGGSDSPSVPTLGGTAAIGAPIVGGTVNVQCAAGAALSTTTAASTGAWQVTISGQTLPCKIEVSGGGLAQPLYSLAIGFGIANITPLTDLVVASLAGISPATWFGDTSAGSFQAINASAVSGAVTQIRTALDLTDINSLDPITSSFTPVPGNPMDGALEALRTVVSDYAALLSAASDGTLTTYLQAYSVALKTAYSTAIASGVNSGGGTGTGGGTADCAAGQTALTFAGNTNSKFTNGQTVCFSATATALSIAGSTPLTNPTLNSQVVGDYAAYEFADGSDIYEVVLVVSSGAIYEINFLPGGTYVGQFAQSTGTGGATGGTSTLTVQTTVLGVSADFVINNVPKPSTQDEFCSALTDANSSTSLSNAIGAAGTFTVNSCSFANDVGTVNASLSITSPVALTTAYQVIYTYR
ncbi:MAG: hypothetical protein PSV24_12915 [Rhodoferax sp.]|nr:hypothetical protein [Rhodoferax sp.]